MKKAQVESTEKGAAEPKPDAEEQVQGRQPREDETSSQDATAEASLPPELDEAEEDTGSTVPLDQYQRLLAEFDNFRKRSEREQARTRMWARAELFDALLPTLDDLDRARSALGPKDRSFDKEGMLIILDRFAEILKGEGLDQVEASPGQVFDPEIHEAVLTVPTSEISHGCVSEVLEKGYFCGERLLRPAKVVVARRPDDAEPKAEAGES